MVVSSTVELARDLIDELKQGTREVASPATMRTTLFAQGVAAGLRASEDQLLTQVILGQALAPDSARKEIRAIIGLVERLGRLNFEINYNLNDFRFDILWQRK